MTTTAYIGMGSNLGARAVALFEALERLDACAGVEIARTSTLLESTAVDVEDQPDFVNAVAVVRTSLEPVRLLEAMLSVEAEMGRDRSGDVVPRGPRVIDLDLLLYGDRCEDLPGLTLPHPRMHQRAFVLVPLVELCPDLVHPVLRCTMTELLQRHIDEAGPLDTRCRVMARGSLQGEHDVPGPGLEDGS
ncbi:MAG: 2-amino-4-hydroxy-6-hydroxymethyldihydropteridine diphosphokinase [Phycisphaerales bacterium]|nr:2-amino-4-hydroxy-6-hydroxymethyldihydropteridine diphosphokinase [Phycisphaerales bacterium]